MAISSTRSTTHSNLRRQLTVAFFQLSPPLSVEVVFRRRPQHDNDRDHDATSISRMPRAAAASVIVLKVQSPE